MSQIRDGAADRIRDYPHLYPPSSVEMAAVASSRAITPSEKAGTEWLASLQQRATESAKSATVKTKGVSKTRQPSRRPCAGVTFALAVATLTDQDAQLAQTSWAELKDRSRREFAATTSTVDVSRTHINGTITGIAYSKPPQVPKAAVGIHLVGADQLSLSQLRSRCKEHGIHVPKSAKTKHALLKVLMSTDVVPAAAPPPPVSAYLVHRLNPDTGASDERYFAAACASQEDSEGGPKAPHCADCGRFLTNVIRKGFQRQQQRSSTVRAGNTQLLRRNPGDLLDKTSNTSKQLKSEKRKAERLRAKVQAMIATDTQTVEDDSPETLLAKIQAPRRVDTDGNLLDGGTLGVNQSIYDKHYPPDSPSRLYIDTVVANAKAKCASETGSTSGFRYPAIIQHQLCQLLPAIGKAAYSQLAEVLPCLPSYRTMSEYLNFVKLDEVGPLPSMVAAMRCDLDSLQVSPGDMDNYVSVCTDEAYMAGENIWSADSKKIIGGSTLRAGDVLVSAELDRMIDKTVEDAAGAAGHTHQRVHRADKPADKYAVWIATTLGKRRLHFVCARYLQRNPPQACSSS